MSTSAHQLSSYTLALPYIKISLGHFWKFLNIHLEMPSRYFWTFPSLNYSTSSNRTYFYRKMYTQNIRKWLFKTERHAHNWCHLKCYLILRFLPLPWFLCLSHFMLPYLFIYGHALSMLKFPGELTDNAKSLRAVPSGNSHASLSYVAATMPWWCQPKKQCEGLQIRKLFI